MRSPVIAGRTADELRLDLNVARIPGLPPGRRGSRECSYMTAFTRHPDLRKDTQSGRTQTRVLTG